MPERYLKIETDDCTISMELEEPGVYDADEADREVEELVRWVLEDLSQQWKPRKELIEEAMRRWRSGGEASEGTEDRNGEHDA